MLGRREIVAMTVVNFIDNLRRDLIFGMKWLTNSDLRMEMSRNKNFKDKYKGERCFILGNGPSLKHHDLSLLRNEYLFTVNNMIKTEDFKKLKPKFHLFFDPKFFDYFFSPSPQNNIDIEEIKKSISMNPDINFFLSYRLKLKFKKVFPKFHSNFVFNNKTFMPQLKRASTIHRNTPGFQNVILYAINIALYMGFEKIYILGVDMTGFLEGFQYDENMAGTGHFYEKSNEDFEKLLQFKIENNLDNEFYLKAFGKTFEQFKLIDKIAKLKNARVFNASQHGALDVLERVNYNKLFDHGAF